MHFALSEEEQLVADTAQRLGREQLAPHAAALDKGEGRAALLANLRILAETVLARSTLHRALVDRKPVRLHLHCRSKRWASTAHQPALQRQ